MHCRKNRRPLPLPTLPVAAGAAARDGAGAADPPATPGDRIPFPAEIVIVGHADGQGTVDCSPDLSHRRGHSVIDGLAGSYGMARECMVAAGAGFQAPVSPGSSADSRAENRRVEMVPR